MKYFFDTSAFVKFYRNEKGTELVTNIILDNNNQIWIMELAKLEFCSSLYRRYRNNEITFNDLSEIIELFENDIKNIQVEPFTNQIIIEAEILLKRFGKDFGLRTLDALHLASCYLISDENTFFVSSDEYLCKVALLLGLKIINPIK
ncbi:MAG: hypothetical protein A2086_02280 [Spirochaetes bacterium GWD1_27_9]|nr:MAG: hypothetical protein A2Z98_10100 [Spirochaetes bacterium GWB1_27_13]OHD22142.1 MAG: hypothetical protein A2Y34_14825 [Spirochaetes bacterium GWC1_27_15]OHD29265.1 MAG: hypothetical protein A2086_02280 [Spirochaetes bacterium GWD1_27_9]